MAENSNILDNLEEYVKVGWEARKTPVSAANLNKMDEAIRDNRDAILSLKEKTNENITDIDSILQQLSNLEESLKELQDKIPGTGEGGTEIPSDISEQLSNLNTKVSDLEADVSALGLAITGLNSKTDSIESNIDSLNSNIDSFNTRIIANEANIADLQNQVSEIEQEVEDLKANGGGGENSEALNNAIKDIMELQSAVYDADSGDDDPENLIEVNTRFDLPNAPEDGTYYLVLKTQSIYKYEGGTYTFIKSRIKVIDGGGAQ